MRRAVRAEAPATRTALLTAAVMLAAMLAGCGRSGLRAQVSKGRPGVAASRGTGVSAAQAEVIEGWANALRGGRLARAAAYWALPSVMVNGPDARGRFTLLRIDSLHDARLANESLSCGATLLHTARSGAYVRAEFMLGNRRGQGASAGGCAGPAGVDFLIRAGHIVRWLRAPVTSAPPGRQRQQAPGVSQPI